MALLGGEGCWREEEDMAGSPSVMKAWAALLEIWKLGDAHSGIVR